MHKGNSRSTLSGGQATESSTQWATTTRAHTDAKLMAEPTSTDRVPRSIHSRAVGSACDIRGGEQERTVVGHKSAQDVGGAEAADVVRSQGLDAPGWDVVLGDDVGVWGRCGEVVGVVGGAVSQQEVVVGVDAEGLDGRDGDVNAHIPQLAARRRCVHVNVAPLVVHHEGSRQRHMYFNA